MILQISNFDNFCKKLYAKHCDYQSQKQAYWASMYHDYYSKTLEIKKRIEKMSFKSESKGPFGIKYHIEIKDLKEYLGLYELLRSVPKAKIEIIEPDYFYITEESNEFHQVE